MINAVIIDDEVQSVNALSLKLDQVAPDLHIVQVFQDPRVALKHITDLDFDLLFLDIDMPGMNGLDFVGELGNPWFTIVFVTAHEQHTIEAIRQEAFDYLLKPVDVDELKKTIIRYRARQNRTSENKAKRFFSQPVPRRVSLPTGNGVRFEDERNILYCISDSNYTTIVLQDGEKIILSQTLKKVEGLLSDQFIRVHNSYLINKFHVKSYHRGTGGSVRMKDDAIVPVSKSRKGAVMELLK